MNNKKLWLIVGLMIGLITIGTQTAVFAGGNFFAINNQPVFATASNDADVNQQLAQLRRVTAKYHDVNVAIEDGFATFNGVCDEDATGAGGIAYANIDRIRLQGVIAEEPELLFYVPSGDDNLRLVAVGYFNRALYIDTRGIIPGTFVSRLNPLPPYFQEVSGPFTLFNQPADGPIIDPGTPWFYGLRAWIWSPNPNGMFAVHNPRLNCTANN